MVNGDTITSLQGIAGGAMEILEWDNFLTDSQARLYRKPSAMTIGVFDGLHRGHAELIRRIVAKGPCPTVNTFRENPKKVIDPASYGGDIYSLEQKLEAFEALGAQRTILIDFSEKFSKLKGEDFIDLLEVKLNLRFLAIGNNFRCGYRHNTNAASVKEMNEIRGIETEIVPPVLEASQPVSSSRIRAAITTGDLALAALLLGRPFALDLRGMAKERAGVDDKRGWVFDPSSLHRIIPAEGKYTGGIVIKRGKVFIPGPDADSIEIIVFPIGVK
jgi:riboflavin kinase/FMN adenylyltransferase